MLNHVRQGAGAPLLLIHGIGSQWQMWSPVLDRIAAERDVVAIDLPGFGESAALDCVPTIAALADAVEGMIDELVPVTIAWGARDLLLIGRQGRRVRRLMPRARHVSLAGCGHVPTWDDPEQVATVLLAGSRGQS